MSESPEVSILDPGARSRVRQLRAKSVTTYMARMIPTLPGFWNIDSHRNGANEITMTRP